MYFDVFKYPLTVHELYECSAISISKSSYLEVLNEIIKSGYIRQEGDYILVNELNSENITKRVNGNSGAEQVMPKAYEYSKIIAGFPFVEGICLSGALSKKYYDENGDIDFFIITKPNRLWLCRTFLIIRYKLLPKSKKKFWCVNYFISSENLTIPDMNEFTGTELAFLIPTINYTVYKKLLSKNNWYKKRFPNKSEAIETNCFELKSNFIKSLIEGLLNGKFGNWLDSFVLEFTLKHWRNKYPNMSETDFNLQFRSRKDVCKRHTHGYQNKILVLWETKAREFEEKFKVSFNMVRN